MTKLVTRLLPDVILRGAAAAVRSVSQSNLCNLTSYEFTPHRRLENVPNNRKTLTSDAQPEQMKAGVL